LGEYLNLSRILNLDPLVEINSEDELEKATRAGAKLIGINNRNLNSFETTLDTTMRIAPLLAYDQIAIAASGIRTREDIKRVKASGIRNFLIGESLVMAENPRMHLEKLLSAP
jgi:indole-3-glycerol phosphate synthase